MRMNDKRKQVQENYKQKIKQKRVHEKNKNIESLLIVAILLLIIILVILFNGIFFQPYEIIR
ncbi:hypothetical protein [Neobacillus mesonae]|uniref:hypothetical protein n=1 Tax=Neobacillus mesonae TaxID=1193713 RepID=UPI0025724F79|nr:hypothetical protein [Neobacillus mesonae]